jgi:NADPH:quinone reductase-like Zn-dependent oxidoreductase
VAELKYADEDLSSEMTALAEGIIPPTSALVGATLKEVSGLVAAGSLKPTVDSVYKMSSQFKEAFAQSVGGRASGKVVMLIEEPALEKQQQ